MDVQRHTYSHFQCDDVAIKKMEWKKMKISQENHYVLVDSVTFKSDLMYIIYHLFGAYKYGGRAYNIQ